MTALNPNPALSIPASPSHGLRATARVSLYTDQAARLWTGGATMQIRGRSTNSPCLLEAFSVLQSIYNATGNDNPFVDASLIRLEDGLVGVRAACQERITKVSELLAERAAEGVETPLVTSEKRHTFELLFGTPYHYMLADAIALWDKAVRHLITVGLTGLFSGSQVREAITELKKPMLATLHHLIRDASLLRRFRGYEISRHALAENTPAALAFATDWVKRDHTPVTPEILEYRRSPLHMRAKGWKPRP